MVRRVIYGDYGDGLLRGTIRIIDREGRSAVVHGGSKSTEQCYLAVHADPTGARFLVAVSNELGWSCSLNEVLVGTPSNPKVTRLPASVSARCHPRWGDDLRIHFETGSDCQEGAFSIGPGGEGSPVRDTDLPSKTEWQIATRDDSLVALPPEGRHRQPIAIFEDAAIESFVRAPQPRP